jgi:hypothetical protein
MFRKILSNRQWSFRLSLKNRICYITGKNLWFKYAYRGQKNTYDISNHRKVIIDEIWIDSEEYYKLLLNGIL